MKVTIIRSAPLYALAEQALALQDRLRTPVAELPFPTPARELRPGFDITALLGMALLQQITRAMDAISGGRDLGQLTAPATPVEAARFRAPKSTNGQRLGDAAERNATDRNTVGWCYTGVADAIDEAIPGVGLYGMSAYMAADQLAKSAQFDEVTRSAAELSSLPRGAVVVWGKTAASPDGHISIALGDGREASDHVEAQMTSLRGHTNFRVFLPK